MTAEYFPKGSSELSAVEEFWRQGKDNLLVSKYYPRFTNLKAAITNYYRTKCFNLNIVKYLTTKSFVMLSIIHMVNSSGGGHNIVVENKR